MDSRTTDRVVGLLALAVMLGCVSAAGLLGWAWWSAKERVDVFIRNGVRHNRGEVSFSSLYDRPHVLEKFWFAPHHLRRLCREGSAERASVALYLLDALSGDAEDEFFREVSRTRMDAASYDALAVLAAHGDRHALRELASGFLRETGSVRDYVARTIWAISSYVPPDDLEEALRPLVSAPDGRSNTWIVNSMESARERLPGRE